MQKTHTTDRWNISGGFKTSLVSGGFVIEEISNVECLQFGALLGCGDVYLDLGSSY